MSEEKNPVLDVEKQSVRGRACPVCGGKIIPSRRAIYESKADPSAVFPLWQCERCGHEEMSQRKPALKPAHGAKKGAG